MSDVLSGPSPRPAGRSPTHVRTVEPTHLAYLPSPSQGVWHLGPVPIRAYALCILANIFTAVWLTGRRWEARGGRREDIADIAIWAVPFGVLGGRVYHVITDPELYFAAGKQPLHALFIRDGGLGIPGAVALGAVGAWLGCRRRGIRPADFADAVAPGLILAQAIGRWGNYFNQELYGHPTHLPWALYIDPANRPADSPHRCPLPPDLPVRVPVGPRGHGAGALAGRPPPPTPAPRTAVRLLRRRVKPDKSIDPRHLLQDDHLTLRQKQRRTSVKTFPEPVSYGVEAEPSGPTPLLRNRR
ncbi:hypothetical protein QFZ66_002487 [Streptomyces sp. B4I13]|nr:hypothetical protein [Streptomyces sp. B4I13]